MLYVRYAHQGQVSYGILDGSTIRQLSGRPFDAPSETGTVVSAAAVTLLAPCEPSKVVAIGLNYRSHLGSRPEPAQPGVFAKYPTCIIGTGQPIVLPPGAQDTHFEGEMVLVIGRTAKHVAKADVASHVFGVTCGNDISERLWQKNDLQWFRAKGSDTFGPLGPAIATGLDYDNVHLQTRLNGVVVQSQRTSDLIFNVAAIVNYVTTYVTLWPGDIIFTGTPGTTSALSSGDRVEVEIEGVGVLQNTVA